VVDLILGELTAALRRKAEISWLQFCRKQEQNVMGLIHQSELVSPFCYFRLLLLPSVDCLPVPVLSRKTLHTCLFSSHVHKVFFSYVKKKVFFSFPKMMGTWSMTTGSLNHDDCAKTKIDFDCHFQELHVGSKARQYVSLKLLLNFETSVHMWNHFIILTLNGRPKKICLTVY
jgi:hypothetical protein